MEAIGNSILCGTQNLQKGVSRVKNNPPSEHIKNNPPGSDLKDNRPVSHVKNNPPVQQIKERDTNGDRIITSKEMGLPVGVFDKTDMNDDGKITKKEFRTMRELYGANPKDGISHQLQSTEGSDNGVNIVV